MNYNELLCSIESHYNKEQFDISYSLALEAFARNRLNRTALYYLASSCFNLHRFLESYKYFYTLLSFQYTAPDPDNDHDSNELVHKIETSVSEELKRINSLKADEAQTSLSCLKEVLDLANALDKDMFAEFSNMENYFGLHSLGGKKYYLGAYDNNYVTYGTCSIAQKSECYPVEYIGTDYLANPADVPYILPLALNAFENNPTTIIDLCSQEKSVLFHSATKHFLHMRITKPLRFHSDSNLVVGTPIKLFHEPGNKKLVLNIFVDSLNWQFFRNKDFSEIMPNTYRFFNQGIICNRAYAGSEYTYPSLASYFTGLRSTHHHMLAVNYKLGLLDSYPLISEIFQKNGYMVSCIGNEIAPNHGYQRGVDRNLFGSSPQLFHAEDVITEVIEHLRAFGERDQYLWCGFMDLHEVAGRWLPSLSVQTHIESDSHFEDNEGGSSLYQTYSPHLRSKYEEVLRRMDVYFGFLFQYVQENYSKEDVVVCLLSDHGNGFNVDNSEPFMSYQRENVPLMFYGDFSPAKVDEIIESIDYSHIITHLAGISEPELLKNDGQLPVFFGGQKEKEYAYSQSLHPDRYFENGIFFKDKCFYFKSKDLIPADCRISIKGGVGRILDYNGNEFDISNPDFLQFREICMELTKTMLGDYLIE